MLVITTRKNGTTNVAVPKWQTLFAAIAQILTIITLGADGSVLQIVLPPGAYEVGVIMDYLNHNDAQFTQAARMQIEAVLNFWAGLFEVIRYGQHVNLGNIRVFDPTFYLAPTNIPWLEFVGIATIIAKDWVQYRVTWQQAWSSQAWLDSHCRFQWGQPPAAPSPPQCHCFELEEDAGRMEAVLEGN